MENQTEEFRDIKGYEGLYQISDLGRVKSFKSYKGINERILKGSLNGRGYTVVKISVNGNAKSRFVHQLVVESFMNHKRGRDVVPNHINFNRSDNRLTNLEIVTARTNGNKKHIKSSSKYTGVSFDKRRKRNPWRSYINVKFNQISLGAFAKEQEAGEMYQKALLNIDLYKGNAKDFRDTLSNIS